MKRALITGITGQDGSYLAELLLGKGYDVHGLVRRSTNRASNIDGIRDRLQLHFGDMSNGASLAKIVDEIQPDEVYNLAAQSRVQLSFDDPISTLEIAVNGTARLLEILHKSNPNCRFYQASSSEMFGLSPPPQSEITPFRPQSPYAVAKLAAHNLVSIYRDGYGMFACSGILFNHDSPRRGHQFVTRKITKAVAAIAAGVQDSLTLGNLEAKRDWGYAVEYVEAMWRMLQQDDPDDYVIATGVAHSVRDFAQLAFESVGLDHEKFIKHDPDLRRPREPEVLCGDATKAREKLGWTSNTGFRKLVDIMVQHDLRQINSGAPSLCDVGPVSGEGLL